MSKRNIILIIIFLLIVIIVFFGFLYIYKPSSSLPTETPQGTNFFADFLPFGKSKTSTPPPAVTPPIDVSGYVPPTTTQQGVSKLQKISSMPVAGFGLFLKERFKEIAPSVIVPNTETPTDPTAQNTIDPKKTDTKKQPVKPTAPATEMVQFLKYVDRATGNIYETFTDKINEVKFSSTIIPQVYEASFVNKGDGVIMRYLKEGENTIETFMGVLPKEILGADTALVNEVKGSFLPENISDLSISPDTTKLFYLFNIENNSLTTGVIASGAGDKKTQIFTSPFNEWLSQIPNPKLIALTTKPSSQVPGYLYFMNPDKKDFIKILGNVSGLTTLVSPNGKLVLYGNNTLSLNVYNIDTKETTPLGLRTLPEKCVWTKASDTIYCSVPKSASQDGYPDVWYRGEVSFDDSIWSIDTTSGNTTMVSDLSAVGGETIDGIKLALDDAENNLFFVNKNNSYLWKLNLR